MKFSHTFDAALKREDYPSHWVDSAISYRQLKKCIRNVQIELSELGLEPETIRRLWKSFGTTDKSDLPLQYTFAGDKAHLKPKLIFTVNAVEEVPVDASLAPETRALLKELIVQLGLPSTSGQLINCAGPTHAQSSYAINTDNKSCQDVNASSLPKYNDSGLPQSVKTIEVPLTSDSTFFKLLVLNMTGLDALQLQEADELNSVIASLGRGVAQVAEPFHKKGKTDLYQWREIFRLYTDSNIFFSTNEQRQSTHDSTVAQTQHQAFITKLSVLNMTKKLKREESRRLLNQFIDINVSLLKNLKFQELNTMATMKILKKFDKRTALGACQTFQSFVAAEPFSSQNLAKRVCFQISEKLVTVVPQLNDYLCPVCFNISFKPIRLRCKHVFCIRCMLVMQRSNNGHCPLCREDVIMKADSTNLDPVLINFLIKYFPAEVKAKQRENERDACIDRFGNDTSICQIM